jgi:hypothetical protein
MSGRRLTAFLDALAAGRRPRRFNADPDDVEVIRTAIALRAAHPADAAPDREFVADLYQTLADQSASPHTASVWSRTLRRPRAVLVGAAASVALIGGTFAVTDVALTPAAVSVPHGGDVRTGTFEAKDGGVLGQIVVYHGRPSWVFMNIGVPQSKGTIMCKLQLNDGSIVSAGIVHISGGTGELSKTIQVDIDRLRGAKLFSPSGAVLASATFA